MGESTEIQMASTTSKDLLFALLGTNLMSKLVKLLGGATATPISFPFKFQIKSKLSKSLTSKFNKLRHFHYGFRYGKLQFVTPFGYTWLYVGYTKKQ